MLSKNVNWHEIHTTLFRFCISWFHTSQKKIIRTCQNHSMFLFELINSFSNFSMLTNNFYNSIINYEIVNKLAFYVQKEKNLKIFFTNHKYCHQENRFKNFKKCFICKKIDCWSINHFQHEQKTSKKNLLIDIFDTKTNQDLIVY